MKKEILNKINGMVLQVLFRGFRVLYRQDDRIKKEIDSWEKGLTLKLECGPGGSVLAFCQDREYGIRKIPAAQHAAITMRFKSIEGAFRVLSGQLGVADAYAAHLFTLEGDIFQAMSFVRCVDLLEAYLFPGFMSKRILKEVPDKRMCSFLVYAQAFMENR